MPLLLAQRRLPSSSLVLVVGCLALAGCTSAPAPSGSPAMSTSASQGPWSPEAANLSVPPHWLNLTGCDEITYTSTVPNAIGWELPPGVHATPVGPSKAFQQTDVTYQTCGRAQNATLEAAHPVNRFFLVRVQPVTGLEIPGVSSYYYAPDLSSTTPVVVDAFNHTGPDVRIALVKVGFTDAAKSQGTARYETGPNDAVDVSSAMAGSAAAGKAGVLGLYTSDTHFVYLHIVRFSDYHLFSQGDASVRHVGDSNSADSTSAESWPAVHNLGYDLRFEFNAKAKPMGT